MKLHYVRPANEPQPKRPDAHSAAYANAVSPFVLALISTLVQVAALRREMVLLPLLFEVYQCPLPFTEH
jgi:hypothetical protein